MIIRIDSGPSWDLVAGIDGESLIAKMHNAMSSDDVIALPVTGQNGDATLLLRVRSVTSIFVGDLLAPTFKSGVLRLSSRSVQDSGAGVEWQIADGSISEIIKTLERAMQDRVAVKVAIPGGVLLVDGAVVDVCTTE